MYLDHPLNYLETWYRVCFQYFVSVSDDLVVPFHNRYLNFDDLLLMVTNLKGTIRKGACKCVSKKYS